MEEGLLGPYRLRIEPEKGETEIRIFIWPWHLFPHGRGWRFLCSRFITDVSYVRLAASGASAKVMSLYSWIGRGTFTVLFVVFGMVSLTRAATVFYLKDIMTRQQISQEAVHRISFITPSGVTDVADMMILTFPSGFDLTTLTTSSFTLLAGGLGTETSRTLGAMPAAGVWGVGVTGQSVTFTAPIDPGVSGYPLEGILSSRLGKCGKPSNQSVIDWRLYDPAQWNVRRCGVDGSSY